MLKYFIFSFIIFVNDVSYNAYAQNIEAHYKVEKTIYSTDVNGNRKKIATLPFEGFLYQKKDRTIYFQRPLYLSDYPDGSINIKVNDHYQMGIGIPMDTLYHIYYMAFDSLISRSRVEISGLNAKEWNVKQHFNEGSFVWKLLSETKEINGLKCQRATFTTPDGRLIYDVWFCPEINVLAGPYTVRDLPGLVVVVNCPAYDETCILQSYSTNVNPSDAVFWPGIFDQAFR